MKKYTLLACLVLLSFIWACDDDTSIEDLPLTSSELLAGEGDNSSKTWRINALSGGVKLNGITAITIDLLNPPADLPFTLPVDLNCLTDNEFTFFSDNTFTATEGAVTCADSLDATAAGLWTLKDLPDPQIDTLILATNDNIAIPVAAPLPIQSLTASEFVTFYTFVLDTPISITTPFPATIEEIDLTVTLVHP